VTSEPADAPLDADAAAVLKVLSRGYRKMTALDVAHAHSFAHVPSERVQTALAKLEDAGFVQRSDQPETTQSRALPSRYGLTPDGRSAALGLP
jgi:RIO-like serine/threonine protein kinase